MIKRIRLFFAAVLSREPLSSNCADSLNKHGSFFSKLLQKEKLPEFPSIERSANGFLSNLLAFEKLPAAKMQQTPGCSFIVNFLTPEHLKKINPGSNHNE
jgi:hypothetical protein